MKKMNPVVHFEMPAVDPKRMSDFYSTVFGWKTKMLGAEMGNYVLATTSEAGEDGRPKMPGTINGGFFRKDEANPGQHPSVVIAVDDIQESMKALIAAGGQLINEPMEIPGVGLFINFLDTEGNRSSLLQPNM